jgi:hypothetical protein
MQTNDPRRHKRNWDQFHATTRLAQIYLDQKVCSADMDAWGWLMNADHAAKHFMLNECDMAVFEAYRAIGLEGCDGCDQGEHAGILWARQEHPVQLAAKSLIARQMWEGHMNYAGGAAGGNGKPAE